MKLMNLLSTLVLFSLLQYRLAERILCPQFFGDEYEEKPIMAKFAEKIKSNSVTFISPECPERLLKHGFYTTLNYLIDNWFLP